ncbi:MAG: C40 family peptidase [Bacteroidales bacterium]|nr:C40 family peptidase [Bacteroidales bacterium]
MKYGICLQTSVAVRNADAHRSEMTNQLLFGEVYRVLEDKSGWLKIESLHDHYSGWIDKSTATRLPENTLNKLSGIPAWTLDIKPIGITLEDGTVMQVLPGSTLPFFDPAKRMMIIEDRNLVINQRPETGAFKATRETIIRTALCFLNSPYLWGGRSLFGIDCSGFTQVVYRINHISLPRDACQQEAEGTPVVTPEDALPGDLAFFTDQTEKVSHVGIIVEKGRIIHASGNVKINKLDAKGIFNAEINDYTHFLYGIRRII